jgi:uncharacterized protein (DUF302 family)
MSAAGAGGAAAAGRGVVDRPSPHSVDETVRRFKDILRAKGITLFAIVDHAGQAAKVGMPLPPTQLLIFGKPEAGTPLMQATPHVAIDLPLKALVWEDSERRVWVSTNSPAYMQERYQLPDERLPALAAADAIAQAAVESGD